MSALCQKRTFLEFSRRVPRASANGESVYGLASHSASAPTGGTAGVSSHAGTIHHVHSCPTCLADSNDLSVRLLEGREWHSLCQRSEGQSKNDHFFCSTLPLTN